MSEGKTYNTTNKMITTIMNTIKNTPTNATPTTINNNITEDIKLFLL